MKYVSTQINCSMDSFSTSSSSIEVLSAESVPAPRFEPRTSDSKVKTIPLHKRVSPESAEESPPSQQTLTAIQNKCWCWGSNSNKYRSAKVDVTLLVRKGFAVHKDNYLMSELCSFRTGWSLSLLPVLIRTDGSVDVTSVSNNNTHYIAVQFG